MNEQILQYMADAEAVDRLGLLDDAVKQRVLRLILTECGLSAEQCNLILHSPLGSVKPKKVTPLVGKLRDLLTNAPNTFFTEDQIAADLWPDRAVDEVDAAIRIRPYISRIRSVLIDGTIERDKQKGYKYVPSDVQNIN